MSDKSEHVPDLTDVLIRKDEGGLCILTLNRPAELNALSPELIIALRRAVNEISESSLVGCVIIRGAGRSFCTGYDLKSRERAREILAPNFAAETINAIAALPQPVIAAVHGHCVTGGLELALAADFIVAADTARFADTHAKWGMRAAWGLTQRLPRQIGIPMAKDMMYSGREVSGAEAVQIGLATRCVPYNEFDAAVLELGHKILSRSPPVLRWIKDQVDHGIGLPLTDALARERAHRLQATADTDAKLKEAGWKK